MIDVTIILAKQRYFSQLKIEFLGVLVLCSLEQYNSLFLKCERSERGKNMCCYRVNDILE